MIKNSKSTLKFVKLKKDFLNKVFVAGSNGKVKIDDLYIDSKKKCITINENQVVGIHYIKNDFEINDIYDEFVDSQYTEILQNGMVKTLSAEGAKKYIEALAQNEQEKIDARITELTKYLEQ